MSKPGGEGGEPGPGAAAPEGSAASSTPVPAYVPRTLLAMERATSRLLRQVLGAARAPAAATRAASFADRLLGGVGSWALPRSVGQQGPERRAAPDRAAETGAPPRLGALERIFDRVDWIDGRPWRAGALPSAAGSGQGSDGSPSPRIAAASSFVLLEREVREAEPTSRRPRSDVGATHPGPTSGTSSTAAPRPGSVQLPAEREPATQAVRPRAVAPGSPAASEAPAEAAATGAGAPQPATSANRGAALAQPAPLAPLDLSSGLPLAALPVALPDLRLVAALALGASWAERQTARFVEGLVAIRALRDAAGEASRGAARAPRVEYLVLPLRGTAESGDEGRAARSTRTSADPGPGDRPGARPPFADELQPVVVAAARRPALEEGSWRPGAIGARSERASGSILDRVLAAWGEPTGAGSFRSSLPLVYLAAPGPVEAAEGSEARPSLGRSGRGRDESARAPATADASPLPRDGFGAPADLLEPSAEDAAVALPARAAGPARTARFLDRLVGQAALRASAPLALDEARLFRPWTSAEYLALDWPVLDTERLPGCSPGEGQAPQPHAAAGRSPPLELARLPAESARPAGPGAAPLSVGSAWVPGAVARRAELLGGTVGVRAAGLASEFVDPVGMPGLIDASAASAGGMVPVNASTSLAARQAARFAGVSWALLSTFPSQATALELASVGSGTSGAASMGWAPASVSAGTAISVGPWARFPGWSTVAGSGFEPGGMSGTLPSASDTESLGTLDRASRISAAAGRVAPLELLAPVASAAARLPSGRQPRGSFLWPRAAGPGPELGPELGSTTLPREASTPTGAPLWSRLRPLPSPLPASGSVSDVEGLPRRGARGAATDVALSLLRPYVQAVAGDDPARVSTSAGSAQFFEQSQPLVSSVPANESARQMVEVLRAPGADGGGEDRISLSELTLISIASATQAVAASPEGGGATPSPSTSAAESGGTPPVAAQGEGTSTNLLAEVEELARRVHQELRRKREIEAERTGDPWES